jgi:Tol biopolymer transport system component
MIAFTSERRGNADIFLVNVNSTKAQQLTLNSTSDDAHSTWSPDGKTIAFDSNRDGTGGEIYLMDANGQQVVRLTNSTQHHMTWQPAWSPVCN